MNDKFITCDNCDEDICEYDMFSCQCNKVPIIIDCKRKCDICQSSGYDCECANSFTIQCPIKRID